MKNDMSNTALIIVDVQIDFCPDGALAVPRGDEVIVPLNTLMKDVADGGGLIVVSRDWHPHNSDHFKKWPAHCVQDTEGAKLHPALEIPSMGIVNIYKGMYHRGAGKDVDGYSAFDGMATDCRTLETILHTEGIRHIIVGGLATDYCVKATVLDALRGFAVDVALYACRHVAEDTRDKAIAEMYHRGACIHNAPLVRRGR